MLAFVGVMTLITVAAVVGFGVRAVHEAVLEEQERRRVQRAEALANWRLQELTHQTLEQMVHEVQRHREGQP